jgi:hypothetical protein
MPDLTHRAGCPRERTETFENSGAKVARCIDCGAQTVTALDLPGEEPVSFEPFPKHGPHPITQRGQT